VFLILFAPCGIIQINLIHQMDYRPLFGRNNRPENLKREPAKGHRQGILVEKSAAQINHAESNATPIPDTQRDTVKYRGQ
jgi:hypothetical protein